MLELKLDAGAWKFITDELSKPFEDEYVKFRPGGKGSSLVYADSRAYQDRLDKVVGAQNWTVSHRMVELNNLVIIEDWDPTTKKKKVVDTRNDLYGGVETKLTIFEVSKEDIGDGSVVDAIKGAYSDGIKRAATLWGVGKYFYSLGSNHASIDSFPDWALYNPGVDLDGVISNLMEAKKSLQGYSEIIMLYILS